MKKIISAFYILSFLQLSAQQMKNSNVKISSGIGIPLTVTSNKFSTCFKGLYEANVSVRFQVAKGLFAGAGIMNSWFDCNKQIFKNQYNNGSVPYSTYLIINSPFLKISYDKYFSEIGSLNYGLSAGYSSGKYNKIVADTSLLNRPYGSETFGVPFIQPEVALTFGVEKYLGFSVFVNNTYMFYKYDPRSPRFNQFQEVRDAPNNILSGWITLGFSACFFID